MEADAPPRPWQPEGQRFAGAFAARRGEAGDWLDRTAAATGTALGDRARAALVDSLVLRLCACAHTALDADRRRAGVAPEELAAELSRARAWTRFLAEYPGVARLLDVAEAAWRRRTGELLAHVARDAADLGAARPAVDDVAGHGERLQARRTTQSLTLAGGARWVHRTKDLAMAAWFIDLCAALNAAGLSLPLHVRTILVRPGCSWDAFVPAAPCPPAAVGRYFARAGMLLRLLERLAAVDFHVQNVLLAGEHPVLVDIETLFAAWPEGASAATMALARSPLRSAFLSAQVLGEPGRAAVQAGGLHPGGPLVLPFRAPRLRADADPRGGLEQAFEIEQTNSTLPAPLGDHVDEIVGGYEEMDALLGRTPDLAARLAAARALPARVLRSSGAKYHILLFASLEPSLLRSETAREAWLAEQSLDEVERAGVRDLEYPRPGGLVGDHPALKPEPPFTDAERARRHDIIRTAAALLDDRPAPPRAPTAPASRTAIAVEIGDFIASRRFPGPEWHGAQWVPWAGVRTLDVLGRDLLSGHAGLALVLASLYRVTRLARFRDAALGALDKVSRPAPEPWLGAFHGLGGAIYALARCGAALDEPALIEQARTLVRTFPRGPLRAGPWDVVLGAGGLLLGAVAARCDAPPDAVLAVRAAWDRGVDASPCVRGGVPACLPDPPTGVAVALARSGARVPVPPDGDLAWRLELDPGAAPTASRRLAAGEGDPLDDVDLALAAHRATGDAAFLAAARAAAERLIDRRWATGLWFPRTSVAERHDLSAVTGLGAVAHALLSVEAPEAVASLRRLV